MLVAGVIMLLGILVPDAWLKSRIARRQDAIIGSLPDILDLITAGTEAGLSFDAAVQRIVARPGEADRVLKGELARYLSDVRLGQPRSEALLALGSRCGVDDVKGLIAALMQADQLGVGVGGILRAQSLHLRTRRRQRAQEAAMKAPVKMLFPLVFFIFPAMFVVILGPTALRLIDQFGGS
ncbi:Bacterial type II secretion system protein F domain protein [compost metagenome]